MIVNAHVHFGEPWGPPIHIDVHYTADELLRDMDRDGVDMSVIIPFIFNYDNEYMANVAKKHPDRIIAYAMMNPWRHKNRKDDIKRYVDMGIKGLKLRSPSEGFCLNDFLILDDVYEACIENDIPLMVHTGDDVLSTPLQCEEMIQKFPQITMILAHAGFRALADEAIRVAKRNKQVILDQTAATSQQLRDAIREIDVERIIWGSDSPYMDERVELEKIRVGVEEPEVRRKILGENILRILKIWK